MHHLNAIKDNEQKKCIHCNSPIVRKNGLVNGVQLFKCYSCRKQFLGGTRLDNAQLWHEYVEEKQTYFQLANKYNCTVKTIQRRLDRHNVGISLILPRKVIVLMDTTYWGRNFGVMLFKDSISKENFLKYYVKYETNTLYKQGISALIEQGFVIAGIVCDGRKGLVQSFENIPVQMCQFHQVAIIRRYLTKKPKLQASKELMEVVDLMKKTDKESFVGALELWHEQWRDFINERTVNHLSGKSFYSHKRLRSAYQSLRNNLPYLFTWYDNIELSIPNTTNAIDGHFADLKNKLRNHNGMSIKRKKNLLMSF